VSNDMIDRVNHLSLYRKRFNSNSPVNCTVSCSDDDDEGTWVTHNFEGEVAQIFLHWSTIEKLHERRCERLSAKAEGAVAG
jgi:hypothetical protein